MKEFIEKWKAHPKFKDHIQYIIYIIFFIFVSIYALSGQPIIDLDNSEENNETYTYKMDININDQLYIYEGEKKENEITINKTVDELTTKYIYKNKSYYKIEEDTEIETTEDEVYGIIGFGYLSLNTVEQYFEKATQRENDKVVYIKDIIIGSNSEDYIIIEKIEKKYKIDYTALMKLFHNDIEKLTVEIIIE